MAEHDNAGFPLSYCLMSTATAVDQGKQTKALIAWTICLKEKYGLNLEFVHVDKDMAEIGRANTTAQSNVTISTPPVGARPILTDSQNVL